LPDGPWIDLGPAITGERFLERLDTKLGAEGVGQPPRQHRTAHPVHDDHQIEKALGHRDIGEIRTPHLVDPFDREAAEEVRVDLVRHCWFARVRALVDRYQPEQPHQPLDPFAVHHMALGRQPRRHAARAIIGPSQIMPVDQPHDREILGADLGRLPVDRTARHCQQPTLLRYRQRRVLALDQRAPFRSAHLPSFRAKKLFSTFN
jgi:hypothetical protein